MMKVTNIKNLILKDKNILIIDKFCDNTLDFVAKNISSNQYIVVFSPNENDKISLQNSINLRQICSLYDSLLFVKNRADIAKLACADGILLDNSSIELEKIKKILDDDMIFGYIFQEASEFDLSLVEKFNLVAFNFINKTDEIQLLNGLKLNKPYFIFENNQKIILE
ncbi:MAG: thiamine phosphate synthase [Candidatus Gastranaerophilales bacterium]|nr:thiamine phosphate synthase [Candidatus Gastranaerophilales bacterium]